MTWVWCLFQVLTHRSWIASHLLFTFSSDLVFFFWLYSWGKCFMITVVVQVLCTLKDVLRSFNPHTAHNCVMPSLCTSSLIHPDNPQLPLPIPAESLIVIKTIHFVRAGPLVAVAFQHPKYQRTASVQWSLCSQWITTALLLHLFRLWLFHPPLRLSLFLSILHFFIPFSFLSQRPSLHPKLSLLICVLPSHINIPHLLHLPSNRVTLHSAVATLPLDSNRPTPVGKHDPCVDQPLVILSILCLLNLCDRCLCCLYSLSHPVVSFYSPRLMTNTSISLQPSPSLLSCHLFSPFETSWSSPDIHLLFHTTWPTLNWPPSHHTIH